MNKSELFSFRNNCKQKLDRAFRIDTNCVKGGANESLDHFLKKAEVCHKLFQLKRSFVTEARFQWSKSNNIPRADIYVLDDDLVIEILKSEEDANLEYKRKKYPVREVIGVRVGEEFGFFE